MKRFGTSILAVLALSASSLFAGVLDGKWYGEMKVPPTQNAQERTVIATLDLQSEGGALKGTLSFGKKGKRSTEIKDARVEGDRIFFSTTRETKKGERTVRWKGVVTGDELHLTAGGKKRAGRSMTLKRV
jgi:hypothetical protein